MIKYILLGLLLLIVGLGTAGYYYVTSYQTKIPGGKQVMQAEIEQVELGNITLHEISIDTELLFGHGQYPQDWQSLLSQKPRTIKIENADIAYDSGQVTVSGIKLEFSAAEKSGMWQGRWHATSIAAGKLAYPLPALSASGTFTASAEKIILSGKVSDAASTHTASLAATVQINAIENSTVKLTAGQMPFEGGVVRIKDGTVYFKGKDRFTGVLQADGLALNSLLAAFMEGKVVATGNVSGTLPITVREDGTPIINNAVLNTGEGGSIKLQPGAIPASNEQLEMVSNVLSNFQYSALSINMSSDSKQKLTADLHVEGNNPDLYNGRAIKLNVHLGGDLLSFIRYSVLPLSDPESFLKKEQHEKP